MTGCLVIGRVRVDEATNKVFSAAVFNAEQIDGLPPLQLKTPDWDRRRADALVNASGADVRHDQPDRAFYRPPMDRICLPARDSFKITDTYYATARHELAHANGYPSRPDRDLAATPSAALATPRKSFGRERR